MRPNAIPLQDRQSYLREIQSTPEPGDGDYSNRAGHDIRRNDVVTSHNEPIDSTSESVHQNDHNDQIVSTDLGDYDDQYDDQYVNDYEMWREDDRDAEDSGDDIAGQRNHTHGD